ncbi:tetratricopeptide repeat protein [Achromobacter sp. NPDC008082]|uniref:tetratricopeptide repeat protein n=1 Tax=Achromobacter sp. NPDC008082 TaxID=3363888 RepID=UPI0036E767C6
MGNNNSSATPALTVSTALSQAYAHWNAGQAAQAEPLCLAVLKAVPDQPDAHHLLGLMAHAYGHQDMAIAHLRAACASPLAPAMYHSNLAEMCRQKGWLADAESAARRAVALDPQLAAGWSNLGIILQEAGQLAASLECLQRVAVLLPDRPETHNNLGNTCLLLGDNAQALLHYERALALNPDHAQTLGNQALALSNQGRHDEALRAIRRAIDIDPLTPLAQQNLARIEQARIEQSHSEQARIEQARVEQAPIEQTSAVQDAAAASQLTVADAYAASVQAHVLRAQGQVDEARKILERAVRDVPGDASARFDLAELLLLQGDFDAGWREYRFRYRMAHTAMRARHVQQPRWEGQPIAGQTLLIHDEQGYGDTFQFLRLVARARERSGARVILEVNDDCYALAERSGGFDQIIRAGTIPPPFDVHCELMSLPLPLGLRLGDLPVRTSYLHADPQRVEQWRKRLADVPRPWVGLVWAGRPTHPNDAQRSLALADLAPLALVAKAGVSFIGLQKGAAADPAADPVTIPPAGMAMLSLGHDLGDFDDTAALITLLDLLVTVDSSPAHLAGALGCPVWVLLPFAPDWRWLLGRDDSPWYPSMRLFRQPAPGEWGPVLTEVAAALSALAPQ